MKKIAIRLFGTFNSIEELEKQFEIIVQEIKDKTPEKHPNMGGFKCDWDCWLAEARNPYDLINQFRINTLLQTMDVPEKRMADYSWLIRNLHFKNSEHPCFRNVINLIKELKK